MKTRSAVAALGSLLFCAVAHASVVYDNLATPLGNYLGGFAYEEVADDVTLGPGPRIFRSAEIAYAGFNFDGDETLTLSLYEMDGAPTPGSFGFNTPGTVLFSQTLPILATNGTTIVFADPTPSIVLPNVVAIGLAFAGVDFDPTGAGSDAGPLLFHPPVVGSSLDDFWLRGFPNPGDPWGLYTFGGNPPINLGARINAVPEPASIALILIGLCAAVVAFGRARKPPKVARVRAGRRHPVPRR